MASNVWKKAALHRNLKTVARCDHRATAFDRRVQRRVKRFANEDRENAARCDVVAETKSTRQPKEVKLVEHARRPSELLKRNRLDLRTRALESAHEFKVAVDALGSEYECTRSHELLSSLAQ